jgi:hypothetical protein
MSDDRAASVKTLIASEDGLLELLTEQSHWLFDTVRQRFQCWPRSGAARPRAQFGAWQPFESLEFYAGEVLIVRPTPDPAIRIYLNAAPD